MSDLSLLRELGRHLDLRPLNEPNMGKTFVSGGNACRKVGVRDLLIESLLRVRSKGRGLIQLRPNRAQREYSRNHAKRSIVLKARQLGITTYVAARFFIQTITQPGTITVQVAHDQESAEEIFKIVHRFWENLPIGMQRRRAVDVARQRPADRFPATGQRVSRGDGGGCECGPRDDYPQSTLFGGLPLAGG